MTKTGVKKWKKIGKAKIIYQKFGKFLERQFFINPEKKKKEFIFFGEPNSVGVMALTKSNKVITVRQFMQGANKVVEHLPAGGIDNGETPEKAIKRELKEETGYRPGKILKVGEFWRSIRSSKTKSYCFFAFNCIKVSETEELEDSEVSLLTIDEWLKRVVGNKVEDPLAIVTTVFSLPYLKYVK